MDISVIYRPPGGHSFSRFLDEFSDFLDRRIYRTPPFIITGDLNIHLDNNSSPNTQKFNDLISGHTISQLVDTPTHDRGHILDVVMVRDSDDRALLSKPRVIPGISDHSAILWKVNFPKPSRSQSTIISRNINNIDRVTFANDITKCDIIAPGTESADFCVDTAVHRYNSELGRILDIHAPPKERKVRIHVDSPWYNDNIRSQKKKRRRLERQWRQSSLHIHRELFSAQRDLVNSLVKRAKRSYYVAIIEDCHDDSKKLFSVANRLLNRRQSSPLPSHSDSSQMASTFLHFFQTKVKMICDSLAPDESPHSQLTSSSFDTIQPTTPDEIMLLFRKLPSKSCQSDPIPTRLLKDCSPSVAPILSHLINMSIEQAYVPPSLKVALITPLLK
ncbi:uncharacterized protein LOC121427303 [Lytechinus variegatus]|uniref:uncharacterized protein LOC121427303 n=1 Tax=Lytechinus variegatus TaxID=7654 RepID=UPI001BB2C357|nr:uncharacterized protein LOC121427303 [Lytechinus variegatus]